ncbi:MAG TPA: response regulator transcription factor [Pirellulaceae bacterium]|nr:response regulator transcription factor [Pirellulaceae bacterium]
MAADKLILTVEDDTAIRRGLVDALRFAGYGVCEASDGATGLKLAVEQPVDLMLLDLALPALSGLEVLRRIREVRPTLPVIVLTAKGDEPDRVAGLNGGADDYVVKPFSVKELFARVAAVLRRSPGRPSDVISFQWASGRVDLARRELCFNDGSRGELSELEATLLRYLVIHAGRVISRDELLANVWRLTPDGLSTRTVDMQIARLREKLRDDPAQPRVVKTVRGCGYMLAQSS